MNLYPQKICIVQYLLLPQNGPIDYIFISQAGTSVDTQYHNGVIILSIIFIKLLNKFNLKYYCCSLRFLD